MVERANFDRNSAASSYFRSSSLLKKDALGNSVGMNIPEYNRVTADDSLMVKRANLDRNSAASSFFRGTSLFEKDVLGNSVSMNIPEYNRQLRRFQLLPSHFFFRKRLARQFRRYEYSGIQPRYC